MADSIGQAYVQILPTTKGFSNKLSAALGGGEGMVSTGKKLGGKLIAGMAAAGIGAAVLKSISESIKAGGELEQSLGGVEALFGKSAEKVKANAAKAYSTVGISANQYMQQVTSFSASLLQGLGGDTAKAASIADIAMKDMGDNVNRFGTEAESVQRAYQGFAKGNFTMLDNLKLGYGGTKTEMLRLVKDAGVVDESVKSINDVSFDQMILAIHKIQENLNITGTTAKEASTTLQGSLASFKALGQDLLGNLAIGADITPQLSAMLMTARTFLMSNLIPMIENVITSIANNAGQIGKLLGDFVISLGQMIIRVAPNLLQAGIAIVTELGQSLLQGLPVLMPMLTQLIIDLAEMLTEPNNLTSLIMAGVEINMAFLEGIMDALPVLIEALPNIVMNLVNTFNQLAPKMLPVAKRFVKMLASGLLRAAASLLNAGKDLFNRLKEKFDSFKEKFINIGRNIIDGIKQGLQNAKDRLLGKISEIASLLPDAVKKLLKIGSPSKVFADEVGRWIPAGIAMGIEQNASVVDDAMEGIIRKPMFSTGMRMDISAADNTAAMSYANIYNAIKQGASEAQPVIILNGRVLSRELKGMGVSFA